MALRKIIEINRDKCSGCGKCTTACAEGALELDNEGKAVLIRDIYCDGLGACLDVCPAGALQIIEKESDPYNPNAAFTHVLETRGEEAAAEVHGISGCPGMKAIAEVPESQLSQWPIQLHLISPFAPYFDTCHLLIAADCTAFSLGSFHSRFLKGKKLIIACPKLDDTGPYIDKLTELIKNNHIQSLTVAAMVVPCCSGLRLIVEEAVERSGKPIPVHEVKIGIDGK
jgi:ferredoxin